jgi:tetratricopeptide (TPR) repeat protein
LQGRSNLTDLIQRAVALRAEQRIEEALETIRAAAETAPASAQAAFGLAQLSFEAWRPAAALFERAGNLLPDNPDLIRNHALALAAEGEGDAAQALLDSTLDINHGWIDGHRTLAAMRITAGEAKGFDRSYEKALSHHPNNPGLWMGWFQQYATFRQWSNARRILERARATIGPNRTLDMAAIYLDSESGEGQNLEVRFAPFADLGDPGFDLCHVRFLLRQGDHQKAEAIALRHADKPSARMFWPYAALCWRLTGDAHAQWLDDTPLLTRTFDLDFSEAELATLGSVLRGLHRLKAPYPEQSVRGGTQTDRQLFFHPDPSIQNAKMKVLAAIRTYIDALPPADPSHPLLAMRRDQILFEGSWSVKLVGAGYHSSHTHVMGWISSALYVALPPDLGEPPAGWLSLGAPPPELGLPMEPYTRIEPKLGRLALFPSTLWHATESFDAGERLTIAFDVQIPRL